MNSICLARRRIVLAGASALAAPSVIAGTLIEGSESSGTGFGGQDAAPASRPARGHANPPQDWRQLLLNRNRDLWLYRRETNEASRFTYWSPQQGFVREGYLSACNLLRDVAANRVTTIDPELLNLLSGIQGWLQFYGLMKPIVILSGFRTLSTNRATEGAARESLHLTGQAADIYIPGIAPATLGRMALMFNNGVKGGVGFYPNNGFVHVDTGRARSWVTSRIKSR